MPPSSVSASTPRTRRRCVAIAAVRPTAQTVTTGPGGRFNSARGPSRPDWRSAYASTWIAPGISQSTSEGGRTSRTVTGWPAASSPWSSRTEMRSAVMSCPTAADEDIAKEWDRPRDPRHHPGHPTAGGGTGHCSRHHADCVDKALVGDEPASGHHLEWTGSDLEVNQAGRAVAGQPIIDRLEEHARADLAEEGMAGLRRGRPTPLEFGRQH